MTDERRAFVDGLRKLANFFEETDAKLPYDIQIYTFPADREALAAHARMTSWRKKYEETYFSLVKDFGGGVQLSVNMSRQEVCRRVVTGKKIIPARPAQPEREEEVIEWVCDEASLLETM